MYRLLAACSLLFASGAMAEVTVMRHFTLIDGTGKAPVKDAALVIDNGRITWAGPDARLKAPAGAQTIDLTGKFVMPGIINLHGHIGNTVGMAQDPKNFTRENLDRQLKRYASYGVTTMVSMGSEQELVYPYRDAQRAGRPSMARLFIAGRGFTGVGGYPTTAPGMKGVPFEVSTPAEVAKDVEWLAGKKVDIVKIWVDDHLGRERKIPLDLSASIIENARKHGMSVAAHIFYLEDARGLVNAGLKGLAHSVRDKPVDQGLIDLMKKKGAWQAAATLTREASLFAYVTTPQMLDDPFFQRGLEPGVLQTLKSQAYADNTRKDHDFAQYPGFLKMAQQNLKKLVDAGVKFGFGTDSGPPGRFQGFFEHWEMQLMREAGLTPSQIIQAATKNSAEFLGAKDLGTLEAGKWADLIVLTKNPLDDIRNSRTIETVYVAGNKAN
jgi:imidazolonepropionase-like amidohydrolase